MTAVALTQGCYFLISGAWSLVHIDSFQKVTGPEHDLWLVKTVGSLLIAIGAGLILAGVRQQFEPGLILIAMASAAALLAIEIVYVLERVISPIYLVDTAIELGFIVWWAACLLKA